MGLSYAFGPRSSAVSSLSWVPSPGQWAEVGLNTLKAIHDAQASTPNSGNAWYNNFLNAWGSAGYAANYGGLYGSIIVGPSGGHGSYDGNDVYAYDIETRLCSLVVDTYTNTAAGGNSFGEYPDGSPLPPHDWDSKAILPVGTKGTMIVPDPPTGNADSGAGSNYPHALDLDTLEWTRLGQFTYSQWHGTASRDDGRSCIWYKSQGNISVSPLERLASDFTITSYPNNNYALAAYPVATIDSRRDKHILWYGPGLHLFVTDLQDPDTEPSPYTLSSGPGSGQGFQYCQATDRIYAWPGSGKTVYYLDCQEIEDGSPSWHTEGSSSSATPPSSVNQAANKLRMVPGIGNCLIGNIVVDEPAWAYRPEGT